jgi:hypothetical protein
LRKNINIFKDLAFAETQRAQGLVCELQFWPRRLRISKTGIVLLECKLKKGAPIDLRDLLAIRIASGLIVAMLCSGCAVIEETRSDGNPSTRRTITLGPALVPPESATDHVVKVTGVGIALAPNQAMLGYFKTSEIKIDPSCKIVLIENTDEQLKRFADLIHERAKLCNENGPGASQ